MKIIFNLILFAAVSFTLFSCSNTIEPVPITGVYNANNELFDYTVTETSIGNALGIINLDRNTYFLSTYDDDLFKVTNGIPELFTVNDSIFKADYALPFDNNYIVYEGYRVSDHKHQFMIYDNGTYTIEEQPALHNAAAPYITERGTFYVARFDSSIYHRYKNGAYSNYTPQGKSPQFGKTNGMTYCIAGNAGINSVYRVEETVPVLLRSEPNNYTFYDMNPMMLKIETDTKRLSSFSESGWNYLFTASYTGSPYNLYLRGNSASDFSIITKDSLLVNISYWNGTDLTKQTNVPVVDHTIYGIGSNYKDNTFYYLTRGPLGTPQKVIRMTKK